MKKIVMSAALLAVIALGVTSCQKEDKARCWKTVAETTIGSTTTTETSYLWGTKSDIEATENVAADAAKAMGATMTFTNTEASEYTTSEDCLAQNIDY